MDPITTSMVLTAGFCSNWPCRSSDGKVKTAQAVVFGLGSLFNHSSRDQNVVWERDEELLLIRYKALRRIESGEELCEDSPTVT